MDTVTVHCPWCDYCPPSHPCTAVNQYWSAALPAEKQKIMLDQGRIRKTFYVDMSPDFFHFVYQSKQSCCAFWHRVVSPTFHLGYHNHCHLVIKIFALFIGLLYSLWFDATVCNTQMYVFHILLNTDSRTRNTINVSMYKKLKSKQFYLSKVLTKNQCTHVILQCIHHWAKLSKYPQKIKASMHYCNTITTYQPEFAKPLWDSPLHAPP